MSLAIGLLICVLAIVGTRLIEGGSPASLFNLPALVIIFGFTFGAVIVGYGLEGMKRIATLMKIAARPTAYDLVELARRLVLIAEVNRRDGRLGIQDEVSKLPDEETLAKTLFQAFIDGREPEAIEDLIDAEKEQKAKRHQVGAQMFTLMGATAPTAGILGAVLGLIGAMSNLSEPEKLGEGIAAAFVATIFGISSGYGLWHPVAAALKRAHAVEAHRDEMVAVAVVSVQHAENPNVLAGHLRAYLPPALRNEDLRAKPAAAGGAGPSA